MSKQISERKETNDLFVTIFMFILFSFKIFYLDWSQKIIKKDKLK